MKWFSKQVGLTFKFFVAPVAALTFMMLLGILAYRGLVAQKNSIDGLFKQSYLTYQHAVNIYQTVLGVNETYYKMISWKVVNKGDQTIMSVFDAQYALINEHARQIETLSASAQLSEDERAMYGTVVTLVKEYASSLYTAKTMFMLSAATGASFMVAADNKIAAMKETIYKLQQIADQNSQANYTASVQSYQSTRRWFLILLGCSAVISLSISFYMARNLHNAIVKPVRSTISVFRNMAEGNLDVAPMPIRSQDEMGVLAQAFNAMLDSLQSKAALIENIAQGDFTIEIAPASAQDRLGHALAAMRASLRHKAGILEKIAAGDLDFEVELASERDNLGQSLITMSDSLKYKISCLEKVAAGNLDFEFHIASAKDGLGNSLARLKETLTSLLREIAGLITSVQTGKLTARGNADTFDGGWHDLVVGMNSVIDAFVAPITLTAQYIDRVVKGDLPEKITAEYQGDFNQIKNNINLLIDAMLGITQLAEAIAAGNLTAAVRERSAEDRLMRALQGMLTRLHALAQELDELTQAVQHGNLQLRGCADEYHGGWRTLVTGVNNVIEAFVRPMTQINHTLARVAQGDLTDTLSAEYQGDFRAMMQQVQTMTAQLTGVVRHVKTAAHDVAQRSREMNAVAEQMSQGASQQAAATEEVSASMQEMAANIRQTADNTKQAEQIALKSAEDAQAGKQAVTQIIQAMTVIAERISVIQEIASQTNMLSLNATIEAAKAQDYGKGFTVVASSVRDLASQTRRSADDIRALVTSCVTLSAQAGEVLERLVPNSQHTSELVQEISASSQEQSHGVTQVNQAVQQLDVVTQRNAATAEELASTAETLTTQAAALQEAMAFFTVNEHVQAPARIEEADLLQRLQQVDHARLVDLLTTALKAAPPAPDTPPAGRISRAVPGARCASDTPKKLERGNGKEDDLDGEFERY